MEVLFPVKDAQEPKGDGRSRTEEALSKLKGEEPKPQEAPTTPTASAQAAPEPSPTPAPTPTKGIGDASAEPPPGMLLGQQDRPRKR